MHTVTKARDNRYNKPVGFYGPIAPPVPNAPSSECLPSFDRCTPVLLVDCCCTLVLHSTSSDHIPFDRRGVAGMANFKIYLFRHFCLNRVELFLQYTGDIDAKND